MASKNIVEIVIRAFDQTKGGLTGPIKSLDDLGKHITKVAPAFTVLAGAAAAAFVAMGKHFVNVADEAGKAAQKIGVTTETYTALAHAAEMSNVSNEQLSTGFKTLNKNIVEAVRGNEEIRATFQSLGVSVRDAAGNLRGADEVLEEVAIRFAATRDGAAKTEAALRLFGKSGQDLIPLLNEGADGIAAMRDEAKALGLVVSTETAAAADELNDNLDRFKKMLQGIVNTVVSEFLPSMAEATSAMVR